MGLYGFIQLYAVLYSFIWFYKVLHGFIKFYKVVSGFIMFYIVVYGCTRFYTVLYSFIRFHMVLYGFSDAVRIVFVVVLAWFQQVYCFVLQLFLHDVCIALAWFQNGFRMLVSKPKKQLRKSNEIFDHRKSQQMNANHCKSKQIVANQGKSMQIKEASQSKSKKM